MKCIVFLISLTMAFSATAQKATQLIEKGNEHYKQKQFGKAKEAYNKAIEADRSNAVAQFNSGNASQRMNKFEDASRYYQAAALATTDPLVKAQAYYNQGLSYVRQNKLVEAVDAFKRSLRLNANDNDARENLQKAVKELKLQQQKSNDRQGNKDKKKPKDEPKRDKSRLSEEFVNQKLKELADEEKKLQRQLQKKNQSNRQLKDW
jgi:Ca-activated chloride channel homolog